MAKYAKKLKTTQGLVRVTTYLTPQINTKLKTIARETNTPIFQVVVDALNAWLGLGGEQ